MKHAVGIAVAGGLLHVAAAGGLQTDPAEFRVCAARVWTMAGAPVLNGCVRVKDGRIAAVERRQASGEASLPVVEVAGGDLLPGLVDLHSHMGLRGDPRRSGEHNERSERVSPDFRILDGFDEYDPAIAHGRSGGVTTALISPGSFAIVGGQSALLKLKDAPIGAMTLRAPAAVKATSWHKDTYTEIDRWLAEAKAASGSAAPASGAGTRIGQSLLRREIPLIVHGGFPTGEVEPVLALTDKYRLRLVIYHCETCDENYEELVARKIPVVVGPRINYWRGGRLTNLASFLTSKGLLVALASDASAGETKYLLESAGLAVHYGMAVEHALASLTINPARIIGIEARVGSLEPGKDADLVLLSGPVFASSTEVQRVFIDGKTWYRR